MTISLKPSAGSLSTVKPSTMQTPATVTLRPTTAANSGPTSVAAMTPRPTVATPTATATSTAAQPVVMRPTTQTQAVTLRPATTTSANTPTITVTPRPQAQAPAPVAIQERPMAANQPLFQFPTTTTQASPAQVSATPKPVAQLPMTPIIAQPRPVATNQPTVSATITPPAPAPATPIKMAQQQTTQAFPQAGTTVKTALGPVNTGAVGPVISQPATIPLNDLQRARAALVRWLADTGIYATMSPEARLAGKDQILSNPDSSTAAKVLAAMVSASTPQAATDQGVKIIIIPDDIFAGYLGAFNLAKRSLNLPESVNSPSAKTIANSIPAIQALINLIDLALAGQALPTDIPAALKDDGSLWWLWTLIGVGAVGTAAYILLKRRRG